MLLHILYIYIHILKTINYIINCNIVSFIFLHVMILIILYVDLKL